MEAYISGAAQISMQAPLSDEWFTQPVLYDTSYRRSVEADYRPFFPPMAARRMGTLIKRAAATAQTALRQAGLDMPDAVITGTGLGCIENTEKFLSAMVLQGESLLQPTHFIHSTHNTISSQVALQLHCHGYNTTFAHTGISFESALNEACTLMQTGRIRSAVVGGHDELTPGYFKILERIGYWKADATQTALRQAHTPGAMAGETSVSMVLTVQCRPSSLARIDGITLLSDPSDRRLREAAAGLLQGVRPDALLTGRNGDADDAGMYLRLKEAVCPEPMPVLWYKHIFGESYTASAFGLMTAATCLKEQRIPEAFLLEPAVCPEKLHHILCLQHFRGKAFALVLLSSC